MKQGDKIIYDSDFGYDVGTFIKKINAIEHDWLLYDSATIKINGQDGLVSMYDISLYNEKKLKEVQEKYL